MTEANTFANFYREAELLLEKGNKFDSLEKALMASGANEEIAGEVVSKMKQLRILNRRKRGGTIVLIGTILCGIGFISAVLLFHSNSSLDWALYGCTTLGISLILYGLYEVMGW